MLMVPDFQGASVKSISSVLLPLDGSSFAENAIPMATEVCRRAGAELRLLVVHEPAPPSVPVAEIPTTVLPSETERRAGLQSYLDSIEKRLVDGGSPRVRRHLVDGPAGPTIAEWVTEKPADLVVMSTHWRGPLSRFWLGSVADYVIRHASIPVLLIRPNPDQTAPNPPVSSILVPIDESERAEAVLPITVRIAGLFKAELTLFRAVAPPIGIADLAAPFAAPLVPEVLVSIQQEAEQQVERVAKKLRADGVPVTTVVEIGPSAAAAILERLDRESYDLVAMSTRGAGGLQRVIVGSVADKVIRGSNKPVLVFHPSGRA